MGLPLHFNARKKEAVKIMRHRIFLNISIIFLASSLAAFANPSTDPSINKKPSMTRYKNPAREIEGWWQVVRHEAASGHALPQDWPEGFRDNKAYLPVGKIIHIKITGITAMNLKSSDGQPSGRAGDGFTYTIFPPFGQDFCPHDEWGDGWKEACDLYEKSDFPFQQQMLILNIFPAENFAITWPKLEPYYFDVVPITIMPSALNFISISKSKQEIYLMFNRPDNLKPQNQKKYSSFSYATVLKKANQPRDLKAPD